MTGDATNRNDDGRHLRVGMIGLGRMGADLARRLMDAGHECVAYDVEPEAVSVLESEGAIGVDSIPALVDELPPPRAIWIMVPAGVVGQVTDELSGLVEAGDSIVDGGNSHYRDDMERASRFAQSGVSYIDCGTSGGVWGRERGYCLMLGGDADAIDRLDPIFSSIAPGRQAAEPTPGRTRDGTAPDGYLRCGPSGAGHFVKMVHNGIEYGMMEAIAEGFAILADADAGMRSVETDAETAPLRDPDAYGFRFDLAEIAEVWRRGTVISSWLVDLVADALARDPDLDGYPVPVSDSGEGRWTAIAAVEEGVPTPVITTALQSRFSSRGAAEVSDRLLSAMRQEFGGHGEREV